MIVVGPSRAAVHQKACEVEQHARSRCGASPAHIPAPYQTLTGRWATWLEFVLPVGVNSLGIGEHVDLAHYSPADERSLSG